MAQIAKPTKAKKATKRTHAKPAIPREAQEADKVAKQMYQSLTAPDAPKAHPLGYIMGASMVLKMLIDQAVQQGEDREALKAQAMTYIQIM
jgi:hypothetical protein